MLFKILISQLVESVDLGCLHAHLEGDRGKLGKSPISRRGSVFDDKIDDEFIDVLVYAGINYYLKLNF